MDDEAPLRHIVGPGEYPVQWLGASEDGETATPVQGSITLEPLHPPRGRMMFEGVPVAWDVTGSSLSAGFPQNYDYPLLLGHLASNHVIYLIDATVETWLEGTAVVYARCALVGTPGAEVGSKFQPLLLQTPFLDRPATIAPIDATRIPRGRPIEWWAREAADLHKQVWTSESATLRLGFECRARTHDPYEVRVRYSPVVPVDLKVPATLDTTVAEWMEPLRGVATIA